MSPMEMTVESIEAIVPSVLVGDDCLEAGLLPGTGLTGAERHAIKPSATPQQRKMEVILFLPEACMIERRGFNPFSTSSSLFTLFIDTISSDNSQLYYHITPLLVWTSTQYML